MRLLKFYLASFVVLFFALSLQFAQIVHAFGGGDGSPEMPLQIANCADLENVDNNLTASYVVMSDLDCSASGNAAATGSQSVSFAGNFDGGGHTLTVAIDTGESDYAGLFLRTTTGANIHDLTVAGTVAGNWHTGGLTGFGSETTINRVTVTANITGGSYVGGLVGEANNSAITDSSFTGIVAASGDYVGGLVGRYDGNTIANSHTQGPITGHDYVGGLVGKLVDSGVTSSYAEGQVDGNDNTGGLIGENNNTNDNLKVFHTHASGQVTGNFSVGGLIGLLTQGTVSQSYATGEVISGGDDVGGLAGRAVNGLAIVRDSFARGAVTMSGNGNAGGLVGYGNGALHVYNSYATGAVTGSVNSGGLSGEGAFGLMQDLFWDTESTGVSTSCRPPNSCGGTGDPTSVMKIQSTFTDAHWNFDMIWAMDNTNDGYPYLLGGADIVTPIVSEQIAVSDCSQLRDIAANSSTYSYDTIRLTQDIDCQNNLNPLFSNTSFQGTFDGGGFTISNVNIETEGAAGLFGMTLNATISNIHLSTGYVASSDQCVGAVVGTGVNTVIQNVTSGWDVYGSGESGGIVGCLSIDADGKASSVTGSSSTGSITTANPGGGIVGNLTDNSHNGSVDVSHNNFSGSLNTSYTAGGVVGYLNASGTLQGMTLTHNTTSGTISGEGNVGGLVGETYTSYGASLVVSDNTSSSILDSTGSVGGMIGYLEGDSGSSHSLLRNSFSGQFQSAINDIGGAVGGLYTYANSSVTIDNSINLADITATGGEVGGLVGYIYDENSVIVIDHSYNKGNLQASEDVGGLVGHAHKSASDVDRTNWGIDIFDSYNNGSVTNTGSGSAAGAIGYLDNENYGATGSIASILLNKVYSSGNIEGTVNLGGLVGQLYNNTQGGEADVTLQDSYSTGSVSSSAPNIGGVIGYIYATSNASEGIYSTVHLNNVYSSGDVSGTSNVGGLVGYVGALYWSYNSESSNKVYVNSSFSTSHVTSSDANKVGGLYGQVQNDAGVDDIHSTNNYWDQSRSGVDSCSGTDSFGFGATNCTAVNQATNTANTQPNYFKISNINEPLHTWNFAETWGFSASLNHGLPCLSYQDGCVKNHGEDSLASAEDGSYLSVAQSGCDTIASSSTSKESSLETQDPAYQYPVGFVSFTLTGCGPAANINAHFTGTFDPAKVAIRKYNSVSHAYTTLTAANSGLVVSTETLNNLPGIRVAYRIADGGPLDQDGVVNGQIVDPVGVAVSTVGVPNTGFSR